MQTASRGVQPGLAGVTAGDVGWSSISGSWPSPRCCQPGSSFWCMSQGLAFMPWLPARLWGWALRRINELHARELLLSWGAGDVGPQRWGEARCFVQWLGWDAEGAALPGCPWHRSFPCYYALKSSCRVASCIGTIIRAPLVAPLSTLQGPQQVKGQWQVSTFRTIVFMGCWSYLAKK